MLSQTFTAFYCEGFIENNDKRKKIKMPTHKIKKKIPGKLNPVYLMKHLLEIIVVLLYF